MNTGLKTAVLTSVFLISALGAAMPAEALSGAAILPLFPFPPGIRFDIARIRLPLDPAAASAHSLSQAKSPSTPELASRFLIPVTAYSSSVDETDSTPHITASGTRTRDGIAASNFFPIGTRLKIKDAFGDKVFVIEDRMHWRFSDRVDIWMPSKQEAFRFGKKLSEVEIVEL